MPGKLRVLHLAKFYPPERGGMERVLQQLCDATGDIIDNVVVAAHTRIWTLRERIGAVEVIRAGCVARLGSLPICPSFPLWLLRAKADLVVLHEPNAPALVADFITQSRQPLVVWYHADLVRPSWLYNSLYKPLLQRALRRASCVIVSSQRLADQAEALSPVRDKCVVIPFGIDLAPRAKVAPPPRWLARFIDKCAGPWALSVGRMVPYKGIDVLLQALANTQTAAVIVGTGPQLDRYKSLSTRLGLSDRVLFAGNISDEELLAAYQHCDLFVLASVTRQEAFGVAQLEAMACGKPVISTDLPTGVPWVNLHGMTGLIVPPGDVMAMANAIRQLAVDSGLRQLLGAAGKARVLAEFTTDRNTKRILELFDQIMNGERVAAGITPHQPVETASTR